jgi:hypothetical protein
MKLVKIKNEYNSAYSCGNSYGAGNAGGIGHGYGDSYGFGILSTTNPVCFGNGEDDEKITEYIVLNKGEKNVRKNKKNSNT